MATTDQICPILLCDVVSSSDIPDGAGKNAVAKLLEDLKQDCQRRFNIVHVNDKGDGFLLLGTSPAHIATAGLNIRDAFRTADWKSVGLTDPVQVRVGLHLRTVALTKEGDEVTKATGRGIDIAARIEQATEPSHVFCSPEFFNQLQAGNIKGVSMGVRTLPKDAGEMELYSLIWEHEAPASVPAAEKPEPQPTRTVPRPATDQEKEDFLEGAFNAIKTLFSENLKELETSDPDHVKTEFVEHSPTKILGKVYVDGNLKAECKIWYNLGGGLLGSMEISYADGPHIVVDNDSSANEFLTIENDRRELSLKPLGMAMMGGGHEGRLDASEAAEYLWEVFQRNFMDSW